MSWTETTTGTWTRDLDNTEFLLRNVAYPLKAAANREHWAINTIFEIQFDGQSNIVDALRRAWVNLRYQAPILASILDDNRTLTYTTPDAEALDKWLASSFSIYEQGSAETFMNEAEWHDYCSLHFFSQTSQLLIRTHHWLNDGTGALHLANKFFELLVEDRPAPKFGDEISRLAPSFAIVAKLPTEVSPDVEEKAQERFMSFLSKLPSVGLSASNTDQLPRGSQHIVVPFEASILPSILSRCKKHGISLAAAFHAAIAMTLFEMAGPDSSAQRYTSVGNFSYRKYLPSPFNETKKWPMGCWMLGLPISIERDSDFVVMAKNAQAFYKQPLQSDTFPDWNSYDHYAGKMAWLIGAPPPPGVPAPTNPPLSSLGLVEDFIQHEYRDKSHISIKFVELWPDVMLPTPVVYQWSWKGRLYNNVCYNAAHYTKSYMTEFIKRVQENLMIGVEMPKDDLTVGGLA